MDLTSANEEDDTNQSVLRKTLMWSICVQLSGENPCIFIWGCASHLPADG